MESQYYLERKAFHWKDCFTSWSFPGNVSEKVPKVIKSQTQWLDEGCSFGKNSTAASYDESAGCIIWPLYNFLVLPKDLLLYIQYTRTDVNISENPLSVKTCYFSAHFSPLSKRTSIDFILNRCSAETCWCHRNVFACVRRTTAAWVEKHSPPSCIFRLHLIRPLFHMFPVAFAAIKDRKCSRYCSLHTGIHQTHKFISFVTSRLLSLSQSLSGYIFPFLMAKTEQRNQENHRIFYLI